MEARAKELLGDAASVLRKEWSRFHVKRAWLFGSRVTADNRGASDWDFLVEFQQPPDFDTFMGLKCGLEQKLGGHVDLLSRTACHPRFLRAIENNLIDVT